ncbi:hypothetical protein HFO39_18590 [Rhizobium leguminosarum]|uniref:hypothetical protein n=1 Tax=Rhizobium leguminosarum TaxID=384 RepID=UPI001C96A48D|nr:hypothetical protein [Rhizobium leguminosarum]MBY5555236.1 hypothetical protein [Rhizobium leguminosarum]MBY5636751.1 hypothetical protein [Rhizobium leguminosarum]MBY5725298.1 hypothetical protein [Rhizobium leguminosarum]MBY5745572.1 hypothetical protein [Rhizobium leguminosarum]
MNWSRGFFRTWILISILWVITVGLFSYRSIERPYLSSAGYLYDLDTSKPPRRLEEYSTDFHEAERRKGAGELVEYEITIDDTPNVITYHFLPATIPHEQRIKVIEGYMERATAIQNARMRRARQENIISMIQSMIFPLVILLCIGVAIRWVFLGFRGTPQGQN